MWREGADGGSTQADCATRATWQLAWRTRDVRVLLEAAELVDGGEHADQLAEALSKQVELEEHAGLVHLKWLARRRARRRGRFIAAVRRAVLTMLLQRTGACMHACATLRGSSMPRAAPCRGTRRSARRARWHSAACMPRAAARTPGGAQHMQQQSRGAASYRHASAAPQHRRCAAVAAPRCGRARAPACWPPARPCPGPRSCPAL